MNKATKTLLIAYLGSLMCASSSVSAQGRLAEETSVPEPTQLHTAAEAVGSVLIRSELLGEIKSDDATAAVLVIDVKALDGVRIRGVKMSLKNATASDQIYIPESRLSDFQDELQEIEDWRHRISRCQAKIRCIHGVARCRPSGTAKQAYCPGRFSTPNLEGGFVLSTPRNNFSFPSVEAAQFDALISTAMHALE